jgi:hypothetical protein
MTKYEAIFDAMTRDPRYQHNLDWGAPRPGHPEGSIRKHVADLDRNLEAIRSKLSEADYWKLRLIVHSHDTFKGEAQPGVAITAPNSHASLARAFLSSFCDDPDLLAMVQYHDEPFALWRQFEKDRFNREPFETLLANIKDWNLFLAFSIVDHCTEGKSREPLRWLFKQVDGRVSSCFTASDIF